MTATAPKKTMKAYLVFRASDQNLRVVRTVPRLSWDEIYWTVDLSIPQPWGRFAGSILIDLPEGAAPVVQVKLEEPVNG